MGPSASAGGGCSGDTSEPVALRDPSAARHVGQPQGQDREHARTAVTTASRQEFASGHVGQNVVADVRSTGADGIVSLPEGQRGEEVLAVAVAREGGSAEDGAAWQPHIRQEKILIARQGFGTMSGRRSAGSLERKSSAS